MPQPGAYGQAVEWTARTGHADARTHLRLRWKAIVIVGLAVLAWAVVALPVWLILESS